MSKVTTRLNNQDIVNLTKQRYESQQRSKLPSIIVDLPSAGKIYPKDHILQSGKIEMRYMTAYDEDILTNISYIKEGVVFDKLLQSIIITDVDINEIAGADKEGLLINARILAYGADYPVKVTNPKTNQVLDRNVDLTKIKFKPFTLTADANGEFTYAETDRVIKFSYLIELNESQTVSETLKAVITQIDESRSPEDIEYFIRYEFLSADAKRFRTFYKENMPGLDFDYEFEGEQGGTFTAKFPLSTDFFWF